MKFLNKILILVSVLSIGSYAMAAGVTYDTADVLSTITNMKTVGIAIAGGFITLAITMMFYKTVRRFVGGKS